MFPAQVERLHLGSKFSDQQKNRAGNNPVQAGNPKKAPAKSEHDAGIKAAELAVCPYPHAVSARQLFSKHDQLILADAENAGEGHLISAL